ncbi:MAG: septation protein IspZ [Burkholderiaceae bacterium]|jgi:intracellular septation protein|nr:septation protein IspZ [Burkholderiaceae bacterium]
MTLLFHLLPLVLFYATLAAAQAFPAGSIVVFIEQLGHAVSGGAAGAREAPAILATTVGLLAATVQVLWLRLQARRIEPALWASVVLVAAIGVLSVWLHHEAFVKWRPSVVCWMVGIVLWFSQAVLRRNLLRSLLGRQLALADSAWQRLNAAWVGFFGLLGLLNVWIAHSYPTAVWLEFATYGAPLLFAAFVAVQAVALARHWRGAGAVRGARH